MLYADVSRAYFYAKVVRAVYVQLPEEDREEGDQERCGKLLMSMYGTRDAALNWASEYAATLEESGYIRGRANPCLFWHPDNEVALMVHGDDFIAVGEAKNLKSLQQTLEDKYKLKTQSLGGDKDCVKEIRVLNKVVRHTHKHRHRTGGRPSAY